MPAWLRRAVPEERLRTVEVGGLSLGAIYELLRARLDATFPRPTLIRLWETSRGNPFFALELATALQRRGGTLSARRGASDSVRPRRAPARAHRRPRRSGARGRARRRGARRSDRAARGVSRRRPPDAGLAEALAARILELDGERLRFTHPLLGSAVAARQTPARRRSLHARLAEVVPSAEERARHLALATAEPTARSPRSSRRPRGRRTPAARRRRPPSWPSRRFGSRPRRARTTPDGACSRRRHAPPRRRQRPGHGSARAGASSGCAGHRAGNGPGTSGRRPDKPARRRGALPRGTLGSRGRRCAPSHHPPPPRRTDAVHRRRRARHRARRARRPRRLACRRRVLRCRALAAYGLMHFRRRPRHPSRGDGEALSLERSLAEWPLDDGPTAVFGCQLWWSADVDGARPLFHEVVSAMKARNDPAARGRRALVPGLPRVAGRELGAGRPLREPTALDLYDAARHADHRPDEFPAAIIAAHRGRIADARARAQQRSRPRRGRGDPHCRSRATAGCSASSSSRSETRLRRSAPETLVRAPQHLHARAGRAPGARATCSRR